MIRTMVLLACLLAALPLRTNAQEANSYPIFGYDIVRAHEIKPYRMRVPMNRVVDGNTRLTVGRDSSGVILIELKLIISPTGDVRSATMRSTKGEVVSCRSASRVAWRLSPGGCQRRGRG
jgi:hypothetical protein